MSDERRQHDRLPKNYRVEVKPFSFSSSKHAGVEVKCVNISAGGLLLESRKKFEIGERLQVTVYIPSLNKYHPSFFKVFESDVGQYLKAVVEVVRVDEKIPFSSYLLGIKFVDVYEDDWRALHSLLQKQMR